LADRRNRFSGANSNANSPYLRAELPYGSL